MKYLITLSVLVFMIAIYLKRRRDIKPVTLPLKICDHDPPFDRIANLKNWNPMLKRKQGLPTYSEQFETYIEAMGMRIREIEKQCKGANFIKCNTVKNYLSDAQMAVCAGDFRIASILLDASAIKMAELQIAEYA